MNTLGLLELIYSHFINFILIFTRIFVLFYTFSVFRREMATTRIMVSLAVILSLYVVMLADSRALNYELLSLQFFMRELVQVIIGFSAGLILNISFEIFSALGQIVSAQIGLSAASLFDPKFGMITTLSNFYIITATIIFFLMNGHLSIIEFVIKSFNTLPVDMLILNFKENIIFKYAGIIFTGSVVTSITLIAAIMMTNICLAIMSKFAPQFNLFSVGLNMSILVGLVCIFLTYQVMVDRCESYLQSAISLYSSYFMSLGKA